MEKAESNCTKKQGCVPGRIPKVCTGTKKLIVPVPPRSFVPVRGPKIILVPRTCTETEILLYRSHPC